MNASYKFLYLEDLQEDVDLLTDLLQREYIPCEVSWVNGRNAFLSALQGGWGYDLIFIDYSLPDLDGDEGLGRMGRCVGLRSRLGVTLRLGVLAVRVLYPKTPML